MVKPIELKNVLIEHDSDCWECLSNGEYILNIKSPRLEEMLIEDLNEVLEKQREERRNRYGDEYDALRDRWATLGYTCTDTEWEDYILSLEGLWYDNEGYDPLDDASLDYPVIPAKEDKNKKKSGSQKFINGIEVDDEEFERYNKQLNNKKKKNQNKKKRGSTKNKKKKYSTWENVYIDPFDTCKDSDYYDEEKTIVFHRDLKNTADTYEWSNLHEFSEWITENDITIKENDISLMLYSETIHCCLNPNINGKELIVDRDFGSLVWNAIDGDESLIEEINDYIIKKSLYI